MARILVIADDKDVSDAVTQALRKAGHRVDAAGSARDAAAITPDRRPDVVVLDMTRTALGSAIDACRSLHALEATRESELIAIVAAPDHAEALVAAGIPLGAWLVEPFSVPELLTKTAALARRGDATNDPSRPIEFGPLRVDRHARRAWIGEDEVDLTAIELRLLVTLHDRRPRVQTREALLADVWKIQGDVTTRTVDTHVKRLREKLASAGAYIETVRGSGYRFAASPDAASSSDDSSDAAPHRRR